MNHTNDPSQDEELLASMNHTNDPSQDEELLASIIAGAETSGRYFGPTASAGGFGAEHADGPCCAIGMAALFNGYGRTTMPDSPMQFLEKKHGVSFDYACGVSDGFEDCRGATDGQADENSADYIRGWAVGAAARDDYEARRAV